MIKTQPKRRAGRVLLTMALGAVVAIGSAGLNAHAADDEEDLAPDAKIFRDIMRGLGLRRPGDEIDYRERPPLVLPSGRSLPAPQPNTPASTSANWPVDPDVQRAKKRKAAEKRFSNPEPEDAGRPLTPSQYNLPGGASRGSRPTGGGGQTAEEREAPSSPGALGVGNIFSSNWFSSKEEYKPFTSEPPRTRLIEPPAGYRTPSSAQPYGVGQSTWQGQTTAPTDRLEPVR